MSRVFRLVFCFVYFVLFFSLSFSPSPPPRFSCYFSTVSVCGALQWSDSGREEGGRRPRGLHSGMAKSTISLGLRAAMDELLS